MVSSRRSLSGNYNSLWKEAKMTPAQMSKPDVTLL